MAHTDERYVDFLALCEGLLSDKFDVGWFTGVVDKDDLIQDLCLHFFERGIENPSRGLILKVARDKLVDVKRRERRQKPLYEPESIESRLRRLSSSLNARDEFELFKRTLTRSECQVFDFCQKHHRYNYDPWDKPSSLLRCTAVGAKFMKKPNPSIIDDIAHGLGISKSAASQRLSRLRTKYFLFREEITFSDGKRLTYLSHAVEKAKKNGGCDEMGWLSTDAAASLLGLAADEVANGCRLGRIIAHHAGADQWFIDPAEIERWLYRGSRHARSFKVVMLVLAQRPQIKGIRRAAWVSERALRLEKGTPPASQDYIVLKSPMIVADCLYETRTRDSKYTWTPYVPSKEDRAADDWVRY